MKKFLLGLTLFICGLCIQFVNCVIEHSDYELNRILFEMELFNRFEKMINQCQEEFKNDPDSFSSFSNQVNEPIQNNSNYKGMVEITKSLEVEIMCGLKIYDNMQPGQDGTDLVILWTIQFFALEYSYHFYNGYFHFEEKNETEKAKMCAEISAYLAAFGASLAYEEMFNRELKNHLHMYKPTKDALFETWFNDVPKYPHHYMWNRNNYLEVAQSLVAARPLIPSDLLKEPYIYEAFDELLREKFKDRELPHINFVKMMQKTIFPNYNHEEKSFNTFTDDKKARRLYLISSNVLLGNKYIGDILFAKSPELPANKLEKTSGSEELKLMENVQDIYSFVVSGTGTSTGGSRGANVIIKFIREIELQKLRSAEEYKKKSKEDIDAIRAGFDENAGSLFVRLLYVNGVDLPTFIFVRNNGDADYLASGEKTSQLLLRIKNLKRRKFVQRVEHFKVRRNN